VSSLLCDSDRTVTTPGSNDYATFRRVLRRVAPSIARDLPWVAHEDPWAVLVSEFMLQQTQTSRVVGPWRAFLEAYPTPTDCANSTLADVLQRWSGLGYHRRAKALHGAARMIRDEFHGEVPSTVEDLRRLPGVGDYTANAVASFAFGKPVAVLDTNVGRILARALTNRSLRASEARDTAKALLPRRESAAFNQAMLDLGAQFCRSTPRCGVCPVLAVCRWRLEGGPDPAPQSAAVSRPQSPFVGSDRQVRGRVLAALREKSQSETQLIARLGDVGDERTATALASLVLDGLVGRTGRMIHLSRD
jgi:A/G-specific adenine glycosylase